VVIDLAQGTDRIDQGLEIDPIDLAQGTDRIDQTDLVQEIVQATDLLLEVETGLGAVAGPVPEQGQAHARVRDKDRVLEQDQVHAQARDRDQVQEQDQAHGQAHGQVQVQDQAQERDQAHVRVQWIDQGQDQVRDKVVPEPVVEVPWAATRVGALLPETVSVVDPVVPANQELDRQGVLRAGVEVEADQRAEVVDVVEVAVVAAEVVVVAVDVNLKWRRKTQKLKHRTRNRT
jgi:hypothetical protein